jgi:hypothetical protein
MYEKKNRTGAMGKLTRECDHGSEVKESLIMVQCWQESIEKVPSKHW